VRDLPAVVVETSPGADCFAGESEILENMADGLIAFDRDWRIAYVNRAAEATHGTSRASLIGKIKWKAFPATVGTVVEQELRRAMTDRVTVRFEHCYEPQGRWLELDACPISNGGLAVYSRDITERKRAEELVVSHARLLEYVHDAIVATDERLIVTAWNRGAQKLYGWRADEVLGRDVREVVRSETDPARRDDILRRAAATGHYQAETIHHHKDGTPINVHGSVMCLRNAAGHVTGYVTAHHDITAHKQAEDALRRAHEELERRVVERTGQLTTVSVELIKEMIEREGAEEELRRSEAFLAEGQRLTHTGSWGWNVATGRVYWSREQFRIHGVNPEAGAPPVHASLETIHPDDRDFVQRTVEKAAREPGDYEWDCRIVTPDGTIKTVHTTAHPVFESGELSEYVGTTMDITERRRAEDQLRESERRFRLLGEAIPHHVWTYSTDGGLSYWNQRVRDYTGLTPAQLQQGAWGIVHPDDVDRVQAAWADASASGFPLEVEQRLRGRDGAYRWFLFRSVPIHDDKGRTVVWYSTNTDIEERKRAEDALHKAHAELTHVTRAIAMGELAATLAHELNQPLAAIVANGGAALRWLDRAEPNFDETIQALRRIIRDAARAGDVIAGVRMLLQKSAGGKSVFDVADMIRDVLVTLEPEIRRRDIATQASFAPVLPAVFGSRIELQQVVLNLIINAMEAMDASRRPGKLAITAEPCEHDGVAGILVAVQDSGVGFAKEHADRLFEAFYTTKADGLGMGLSISHSIVRTHGGVLSALTNPGQGATFQFVLPAWTGDAATETTNAER
jgi:PAS domain S-box-containing protein